MKAFEQIVFLIADFKRWKPQSPKEYFYYIFEFGIWATILYRISRMLFLLDIPLLKIIFRLASFFIFKINELLFKVYIPASVDIGPGLYIGHISSIFFYHTVKAGKNLSIGQGVTIGTRGVGYKGAPFIGDNVYIGTGAKILGNIKIGNYVKIGANAVVIHKICDHCTAIGVPAKIIKNK